ncbi:uncharacterized protein PRCAT00002590001 [Priceomyces carsonii]|uniref:uncharacterized protein n=1 Tax=Priceomyces carsonii TaxID=28549 RepID=UPI002ED87CC4|nr:unnamed protein product [Priceomyces carsonii]
MAENSSNLKSPRAKKTMEKAKIKSGSPFLRSQSGERPSKPTTPLQRSSYIPPWSEPYIIGVAGNSGSGKTSVSQRIIQELNQPWTVLLSFDNFYKPLNKKEREIAFKNEYDFDMPTSLDLDLLVNTVKSLKRGEKTEIPVYSFEHHNRTSKTTTIYGANVIIIEGIYALYDSRLLDLMDIKIYIDTALDVCLARRLTRDILYRGRDLPGALKQWETFVKPNAVRYVSPTMLKANLVIPRGMDNQIAINLMIKHIQKQLLIKSYAHLKNLKELGLRQEFKVQQFRNIKLLPETNHTRGINSILFNKRSERADFIFYFDRIAILIIEGALEFLTNFKKKEILTPTQEVFHGVCQDDEIIAVNVIRSGDCFMNAIKKTFPEISIGKLLIQSDSLTGEPQLHTDSLPKDLISKKVFLFDAQIISGAAAIMAIQVLIDHGAKEEDMVVCSYLSTEIGLKRILNVFPHVKLVLGKLSSGETCKIYPWYNQEKFLDTDWHFRNRFIDSLYFGTN